jgi:branched-chain amino acid aminotransferase
MEIRKELLAPEQRKAKPTDDSTLGFGQIFTDHMFCMDYIAGKGWIDPRIVPYGPFSMDPASLVFHYAQETFEGLKGYRSEDGRTLLFRPERNAQRLNQSNARMCIPEIPVEDQVQAISELVGIERDWIPRSEGTSLYIRPTVIATQACLGVKASSDYLFYVIVGPVGPYYPQGFSPTKIYVEEEFVRAVPGGVGFAKTGGNYAASILAGQKAAAAGFAQVLWLDACDRKTVEEVGTSNMFVVIGDEILTAPLGGSILPGVTRDSVMHMCKEWGLKVTERRYTIDEVIDAQKKRCLERGVRLRHRRSGQPGGFFDLPGSGVRHGRWPGG